MTCFYQADSLQREGVPVFGDYETGGNGIPEQFLDNLPHFRACFTRTDDNESPSNRNVVAGYRKRVILELNEFGNTNGRTRRIECGFPDEPRTFAKVGEIHPNNCAGLPFTFGLAALRSAHASLQQLPGLWLWDSP